MYRSLMALMEQIAGAPEGAGFEPVSALSEPPESLLRAVDERSCFLFAGEELSSRADVPCWHEFVESLGELLLKHGLISPHQAQELNELLQSGLHQRVAAWMRRAGSLAEPYAAAYARELYSRTRSLSGAHKALAKVPFCAAVTPNLDPLLEQALDWETLVPADGLIVQDRVAECLPFVLKLRGFGCGDPCFLWPDEAASKMRRSCAEALQDLFHTKSMLAVGISPDELLPWLEGAGVSHPEASHFLITSWTDDELRRKAAHLYRQYNISVLLAPATDSPEVLSFLNRLDPTTI